jgi:hypothetical protein
MNSNQSEAQTTIKNKPKLPKLQSIILWLATLAVFALGLGIRLYDITDEPLDFHPTRQLRGAIIARGMYYDILPDADPDTKDKAIAFWFSTGQYEPSILEYIVSRTYLLIGGEHIWVARLYNSLFWIIGGIALFILTRSMLWDSRSKEFPKRSYIIAWISALVALAYYLLNPFGVQASRTFQPDPGMVMWIILTIYALHNWSQTRSWKWTILSGIFAGIAVLTKAVAAYTIAGAAVAIVIYTISNKQAENYSDNGNKNNFIATIKRIILTPQVWVMIVLMITPMTIYYAGREGRASQYFNSWTIALSHLLLEPQTYVRWLHLVESLMGLAILLLAILGVLIARPRSRALLLGLWIGYVIYGMFLPYQMYTHSYYHLQLVPIIAISLASVIGILASSIARQGKIWQVLAVIAITAFMLYTSWIAILPQYSEDYHSERQYWEEIGSLLPSNGKIVGLTQDYGYRLMYYGWHKVKLWPSTGEIKLAKLRGSEKEFDTYFSKRIKDASYFLVTSFKQFNNQPVLKETLYEKYPVYAEGPGYLIFDLSQPKEQSNPR